MKQMNWPRTVSVILMALAILFLAACQAETVDSAKAADIHTARWQAMADYYAQNDLLTRDESVASTIDDEVVRRLGQTALFSAQVHDTFDYEASADNQAARWVAMGRYYEKMGLLNPPSIAATTK